MRAELDAHDLRCLSGADALATLAGHRPGAIWEATGVDTRPTEMQREARTFEDPVDFAEPAEGASIADDYASMGLTLRRHPLALLRGRLAARGVRIADSLRRRARDSDQVWASGIVTHRQQPSTASGVIFATLEDETGTVTIIVWPSIAVAQRSALRGSALLTVQGTWQSEKGCTRWWRRSSSTTARCEGDCACRAGTFDEPDDAKWLMRSERLPEGTFWRERSSTDGLGAAL